ncbi:carcinoembryonic antigen-related cell adhesion molecule 5-like [Colossoma macropomum]|uniref:carcinoembryonic antigen-related cell adhesion molecule 5-like n=1 Tax=Colossoma macropomum TaxID=42526 RepID=UPI001864DBEB|nr:carcinoembryonic antigen-related cell adhesion molecule 5-like [Colossoma macropomum]
MSGVTSGLRIINVSVKLKEGKKYEISNVDQSDEGDYSCKGTKSTEPRYSETSDAVRLTVSDKPKPAVRVEPQSTIYTGDTVTLICEPQLSLTGWKFLWYKNTQSNYLTADENTNTISITVSNTGTEEYKCIARRGETYYTHYSDPVKITVRERPKAKVKVQPAEHVFIRERVTLTCDIEGGDVWSYEWFKNNKHLSEAKRRKKYEISNVDQSDEGDYSCKGTKSTEPRYSETSDAVRLTVSAVRPKPELTSSLEGAVLRGDSVILECRLDESSGWRFYWFKHTQIPQNEIKTETHFYIIRSVSVSDEGQYWCRAVRGNPAYYTQYSDVLWVNVTATSPPVSLIISPSRTQHFTTDRLSLSCEGQSESTGWRVRRYTHSGKVSDCSSDRRSVTGSTCNISSISTSHTGVYWCQSESGGRSSPVNITVHNGDVILESPVHAVTDGDSLTLRCLYHSKPSNLTADFYKDGFLLQTQTTGEMTISSVSKSDEGLYHCKHSEKGESPKSWISVRGAPFSVLSLLSSLLAVSPYLLVSIILGVKCYRARPNPDEASRT